MAPVQPIAGRLVFVKVAVVVMVNDNDQASVMEPAQTRRDQALVAARQVGAVNLAMFEPGRALIVAGQQGQDLILQ